MKTKIIFLTMLLAFLGWSTASAQVGIGTQTPNASSILDLTAADKGFLLPRLTTTQRDAIQSPTEGLVIFNTTTSSLEFSNGTQWVQVTNRTTTAVNAGPAPTSAVGNVGIGTNTPNANALLDLTATNKGFLPPRMTTAERDAIVSPAVGLIIYNTTIKCIEYNHGSFWINLGSGTIAGLSCGTATNNGTLIGGIVANGVNSVVPYTGGNAGLYNGQTVNSTGVTGLTATLVAGNFASGNGSLTYTITGTPSGLGTATFALSIGGQACSLSRTVLVAGVANICNPSNPTIIVDVVSPTGKTWMDRNLGANRAATSLTDAESYGHLWQWGRPSDGHQCVNRYTGDGVTTSGTTSTLATTDQPAHGLFITTNTTHRDWRSDNNNNRWNASPMVNNPCPTGYRVPTEAQLDAERLTWATNNGAGAYGSPLKWSGVGERAGNTGNISFVGSGWYKSSTINGTFSTVLGFNSSTSGIYFATRSFGHAVRCIKD